jgi:hypothetical protein
MPVKKSSTPNKAESLNEKTKQPSKDVSLGADVKSSTASSPLTNALFLALLFLVWYAFNAGEYISQNLK